MSTCVDERSSMQLMSAIGKAFGVEEEVDAQDPRRSRDMFFSLVEHGFPCDITRNSTTWKKNTGTFLR